MKSSKISITVLSLLLVVSVYFNFTEKKLAVDNASLTSPVTAQFETLCEVAKEHLKGHWSDHKNEIEKVIHVVNNDKEMQAKLKTDLDQLAEALNVPSQEIEKYSPQFEKIFFPYVQRFREHLNKKDPDWKGMFQTMKEFYAAEDKLIEETFGKDALNKFRASQLKKRTPMLALLGQYAEIPWDQNIVW